MTPDPYCQFIEGRCVICKQPAPSSESMTCVPTPAADVCAEAERLLVAAHESSISFRPDLYTPEGVGDLIGKTWEPGDPINDLVYNGPRLVRALVAEVHRERLRAYKAEQRTGGAEYERDQAVARAEKAEAEITRLRTAIEMHRDTRAGWARRPGDHVLWATLEPTKEN